jgi:hypothetical protein
LEWVVGIGEHKVLPDHKACLVTHRIEDVKFVMPTSPYSHHVEVCSHSIIYNLRVERRVSIASRQEVVYRNKIGAFSKYRKTIDSEMKGLSLLKDKLYCPESNCYVSGIFNPLMLIEDTNCETVEVRLTNGVGPPELRIIEYE